MTFVRRQGASAQSVCLVFLVSLSPGCADSQQSRALRDTVATLEKDVAALREDVDFQKTVSDIHSGSLRQLSDRIRFTAVLDVTAKTYSRIDGEGGTFLISVDNVQPYANGQRLTLQIGNPQSVTFNGFVTKMRWGRAMPTDVTERGKWWNTLKEQDFKLTDSLRGGAWNRVQITLAPASPDEVGYVEVQSFITDQVALATRQ